jgi:hypothetical protein
VQSQLGNIHFASSYSGYLATADGAKHTSFVATVEGPYRQLGTYILEEVSTIEKDSSNSTKITIDRGTFKPLFPKERYQIECLTSGPEMDSLIAVANTGHGLAVFYLPRSGYQREGEPQVNRLNIPSTILSSGVTACAAFNEYVYIALKNGGIRQFSLAKSSSTSETNIEGPFWQNSRSLIIDHDGGPINFTSLVISPMVTGVHGGGRDFDWYGIYGVAVNGSIYRFSIDGVPDRRIEFEPLRTKK